MKNFAVSGSYRAHFVKIICAETETDAWNKADKLDIENINSDDEDQWDDIDIDDVAEVD